ARRHGDAVRGKQFLGLVFVEVHACTLRRGGIAIRRAAGGARETGKRRRTPVATVRVLWAWRGPKSKSARPTYTGRRDAPAGPGTPRQPPRSPREGATPMLEPDLPTTRGARVRETRPRGPAALRHAR